ncbi:hypothetical protein Bca52824_066788 [Brassica carinata]|uniref:Uncharacterized protein n=1 Tax=Brassica carinata TaxID=52824 RepID=A0A8X7QM67_BRACI|nr:hypothetical protein Bca52824_066788 [Brassica carinata]
MSSEIRCSEAPEVRRRETIEDKQSLGDELSLETNLIQEKNETNQYPGTTQDWELSKEHNVLQQEDSGCDYEPMKPLHLHLYNRRRLL